MSQSKKLLLLSIFLYASFLPIFGMKYSQNKISVWPFLKLGLIAGSVAVVSYYAYEYFNKKNTGITLNPISNDVTQISVLSDKSDRIEQTIDLTPTGDNHETLDKEAYSDSDESFDNIPCIQMKKSSEIIQETRERLMKSAWYLNDVISFDLRDENILHINNKFSDIQQESKLPVMNIADAIKDAYTNIESLKFSPEQIYVLRGKIVHALEQGLFSSSSEILTELTAFISTVKVGAKDVAINSISQEVLKILKHLQIIKTTFRNTKICSKDSPKNKIILLAIHGTWSNPSSYGCDAEKPLSQAIINFTQSLAHMRQCTVELWSIAWSGNWSTIDRQISGAALGILLSLERAKSQVDEIWTISHSHGCNVSNAMIVGQPNCCIGAEVKQPPKIYAIHIASPIRDGYINKEKFFENIYRLYHFYSNEDQVVRADALSQRKFFNPLNFNKDKKTHMCRVLGILYKHRISQGIQAHSELKLPIIQQLPLLLMCLEQIYECHGDLDVKLFDKYANESIIRPLILISSDYEKHGSRGMYCSSITDESPSQIDFELQYSRSEKFRSIENDILDDWEYVNYANGSDKIEENSRT